jgi:hypothetical protein
VRYGPCSLHRRAGVGDSARAKNLRVVHPEASSVRRTPERVPAIKTRVCARRSLCTKLASVFVAMVSIRATSVKSSTNVPWYLPISAITVSSGSSTPQGIKGTRAFLTPTLTLFGAEPGRAGAVAVRMASRVHSGLVRASRLRQSGLRHFQAGRGRHGPRLIGSIGLCFRPFRRSAMRA